MGRKILGDRSTKDENKENEERELQVK